MSISCRCRKVILFVNMKCTGETDLRGIVNRKIREKGLVSERVKAPKQGLFCVKNLERIFRPLQHFRMVCSLYL